MFAFKFEELEEAYNECLKRFGENLLIAAPLHSIRELFLSGQGEYAKADGTYCFGFHNALGFRILAANILSVMLRTAIEESFVEHGGIGTLCGGWECTISGTKPDFVESDKFWDDVLKDKLVKQLNEPALEKWCDVFRLPLSTVVNINALYYTNEREIKRSQD